MQQLLSCAVSDPAVSVRKAVLQCFVRAKPLFTSLAQSEALATLFIALNDESSGLRSLALQLAGALSAVNPAFIMPALRRHLLQLLSDMECAPDTRQREDSAKLLGVLIGAAPKLVLPYTTPILSCLINQLAAGQAGMARGTTPPMPEGRIVGSTAPLKPLAPPALPGAPGGGKGSAKNPHPDDGFELFVLMTLGELARVAGSQLQPDVGKMLPFIISAIQEDGSSAKRLVAVRGMTAVICLRVVVM